MADGAKKNIKGRGAQSRPANRYERVRLDRVVDAVADCGPDEPPAIDRQTRRPLAPAPHLRLSGAVICFIGAIVLYASALLLVYLIQTYAEMTPTMELLGLFAYFCSVLPIGPCLLVVVGIVLAITRR